MAPRERLSWYILLLLLSAKAVERGSSRTMNRLFHTALIDGPAWGLILTVAVTVHVVVEVETWLRLQWKRRMRAAASTGKSAHND